MKKILLCTIAALALFFVQRPAFAQVTKAILYPASAQFYETSTVKLKPLGGGLAAASFQLPGPADPETLLLESLPGKARLADLSWKSVKRPESKTVQGLRNKLQALENNLARLQGEQGAASAQIALYTSQDMYCLDSAKQARELAAIVKTSLPDLYTVRAAKELEIQKIQAEIEQVRKELAQAVGEEQRVWEVAAVVDGAGGDSLRIAYNYVIHNCGWQPAYRIEALPGKKKVDVLYEAEVWQGSGRDVGGADVYLATSRPSPAIKPPSLPAWIIRPRPEEREGAVRVFKAAGTMAMAAAPNEEALDTAAEPELVRMSTFALWKLGKRSLPTGERKRLTVSEESWPAEFSWLLRPSLTPDSYLRAEITLDEAREMPTGKAMFLVDGSLLATRSFSFAGTRTQLYFGKDPLVSSELATLQRQSGGGGFLSSSQTYDWSWVIKVKNDKGYAVPVRVEEPRPESRSKDIEVELQAKPQPAASDDEKDKDLLVWVFEAPAKSSSGIEYSVHVKAPDDMKLDLGWK
jgi:uncharacterized protein (TIGR02231 family)